MDDTPTVWKLPKGYHGSIYISTVQAGKFAVFPFVRPDRKLWAKDVINLFLKIYKEELRQLSRKIFSKNA